MACSPAVDRQRNVAIAKSIVITLHGLYGGMLPLWPVQSMLNGRESFSVEPFRYRPRMDTLETSGKQLSAFLRQRKPHTADNAIHFVTHGYGALVLREAFRTVDWNDTSSRIVMIAPPNRGVRYYRAMHKRIGIAGYGGVAATELATLTADALDERLGKLPRRCSPLVVAGSLCLNPFNQANFPNDGIIMVEETTLPGEFRHQVLPATHNTLPLHPATLWFTSSFLEA